MTAQPYDSWTSHLGDLTFELSAPVSWAAQQRRYLADYLPGHLGDQNLGAFRLVVQPDDARCEEVAWDANRPPVARHLEPVPGVVLTETRTPTGARSYAVAADALEHQTGAYAVRVHGRSIELYLHSTARRPHAHPLRLMREAMLRTYEDHGGVVFHSAGVDIDGHGVMIVGPRSAGKTTLLTCLIRATRGTLLSNDRLILDHQRRLVAVPLPVPVARGTVEAVPELADAVPGLSRPQRPVDTLPTTFGTTQKVEFSAREYATALGTSLAPGSWLRTIIVPRLTDTAEPATIRTLPPAEARRVLSASCFTPRDEFWRQPWLVPRATPDAALRHHAEPLVRNVADTVPCVEIRFGIRNPLSQLEQLLPTLETTLP
ncbi:phosphoenolpyruvate carboxykinase (ATP) [Saccharomonospora halophila]|uniref:hypothetical protein n=1 Tax=Saccharomonospora halophila TaxID=129922 RepID=UPI0003A1B0AE|nr:hypothetical protein [Saccharomonospora halophila]